MESRADVQYLPALFFELRERRPTNVERAFEIDVHHSSKTIWRQLLCGTEKVSGSAVHDDIDLAEVFDGLCDSFFNLFRLTHISNNCEGFTTFRVDGVRRRLQVIDLSTRESNTRTRFCKGTSYPAGDTGSTTGHKRDASIQNSVTEDSFAHSFYLLAMLMASSSLNFPSYKALPTMTMSRRASPASRRRLISSRLDTPPDAVTLTFAARATARVCSMFGPVSIPSRAMSV